MKQTKTNTQEVLPEKKRQLPSITVDILLFKMLNGELSILLVKRKFNPFQGKWAIPGGFVEYGESLDMAAKRELLEETGLNNIYFEQLYTFGNPNRDPRGHVITVSYLGLVPSDLDITLKAGSDAEETQWFSIKKLPSLAFDHQEIVKYAIERLINKLEYTTAGFSLLPSEFTLSDLQKVYESVLQKELDKRNFRRKLKLIDILNPLEKFRLDGMQRPAQLYQLSHQKFEKLKSKGILFPF